jgi:archaellum component FlaC
MILYILIAQPIVMFGMLIYVYNRLSKRIDSISINETDINNKLLYMNDMSDDFYNDFNRLSIKLENNVVSFDEKLCYVRGDIITLNERCSNIEKVYFELKKKNV